MIRLPHPPPPGKAFSDLDLASAILLENMDPAQRASFIRVSNRLDSYLCTIPFDLQDTGWIPEKVQQLSAVWSIIYEDLIPATFELQGIKKYWQSRQAQRACPALAKSLPVCKFRVHYQWRE